MSVFLGVDQSLTGCGLALLDADGKVMTLETVDPGNLRRGARLCAIKSHIVSLLQKGQVVAGCREGYSYGSVGKVFELGEVGGAVEMAFFEHSAKLDIVAPTALKKFATGNPRADKAAMIAAATAAGAVADDDNQADAFFLSKIAYHLTTKQLPVTRTALEVLNALERPANKTCRRLRKIVKNGI